jgi:predicted permease
VGSNGTYFIDHLPAHPAIDLDHDAVFSVITPRTFSTIGVPLLQGRDFDDTDVYDAPFTVIINESMARKAFPGQNPLGRILYCGFDSMNPMTIVGVVGDVREYGPATAPSPELFMPYEQHPRASGALTVVARTSGDPASLSEVLRKKVRERSPDVPLKFTTMEASLAQNVAGPRFRTLLFAVFAGLAICLAMAGVYGVMAYMVGQRLNEIGLRMALGASQGEVLGLVMKQGLALAGAGLALGLAGAFAATRLLTSFLFEVKSGDPATYLGVAALLAIVAMAATYLPARRATQIDPLAALRQE